MFSITTTTFLTLLFLIVATSAQDPKAGSNGFVDEGRSCEVEAVFEVETEEGKTRYYSVERAVQHEKDYDSHVATWTKWMNGFPVIDQDHNSLNASEKVFPKSFKYVIAAMVDHNDHVVVLSDYGNDDRDKSPITGTDNSRERLVVYKYNFDKSSRTFTQVPGPSGEPQSVYDYFPFINKLLEDENVTFSRVLAMTYLKQQKTYVVNSWTLRHRNDEQETYFFQTWVEQDRTKIIATHKLTDNQYIPNLLHVKSEQDSEEIQVIEGAYGIWRHNEHAARGPWKPESRGAWHMHDTLLGCPQNLCFDADVDAIANKPDGGAIIFRGCYYWTVEKSAENDLPGRLSGARLITHDWPKVKCNVWAAFIMSDTIYIFQETHFFKCQLSTKQCDEPVQNVLLFKGIEHVSAATVDSQQRIWLLGQADPEEKESKDSKKWRFQYSVFKLGQSQVADATPVYEQQYLQPKFPFLPKVVDDMMTDEQDNSIIFFTQSHFFRVKEADMERDDFDQKSVKPEHTPGMFYRCDDGLYAAMAAFQITDVHAYYAWREPPKPAPPMDPTPSDKGAKFNWLWLLLLLLLLIPLCCFIPCRKSRRNRSDPQAPPESVFARSALGSVLSAIRPDNDLRSSMSTVPSDMPYRSPNSNNLVKSRDPSRSGISNVSGGNPATAPGSLSGASRSGMSHPSGGSPAPGGTGTSAPGSRSALSNPSGGSPSPGASGSSPGLHSGGSPSSGSRRSGLSNPSGGSPNSGAPGSAPGSRSGVTGPLSGGSPSSGSRRSGLSNPSGGSPNSGGPGSAPGSRSGVSGPLSGGSPSSGSRRSGLSNPSGGGSPGSASNLAGTPSAGAPSSGSRRSGMSNPSGGGSPNSGASRSGLSNPSGPSPNASAPSRSGFSSGSRG